MGPRCPASYYQALHELKRVFIALVCGQNREREREERVGKKRQAFIESILTSRFTIYCCQTLSRNCSPISILNCPTDFVTMEMASHKA